MLVGQRLDMDADSEGGVQVGRISARYINERRQARGALTKKNFRRGEFLENCSAARPFGAFLLRRAPRLAAETLVRSRPTAQMVMLRIDSTAESTAP